jgi:hypothetical protein
MLRIPAKYTEDPEFVKQMSFLNLVSYRNSVYNNCMERLYSTLRSPFFLLWVFCSFFQQHRFFLEESTI